MPPVWLGYLCKPLFLKMISVRCFAAQCRFDGVENSLIPLWQPFRLSPRFFVSGDLLIKGKSAIPNSRYKGSARRRMDHCGTAIPRAQQFQAECSRPETEADWWCAGKRPGRKRPGRRLPKLHPAAASTARVGVGKRTGRRPRQIS
jgi:hypothetical protein